MAGAAVARAWGVSSGRSIARAMPDRAATPVIVEMPVIVEIMGRT